MSVRAHAAQRGFTLLEMLLVVFNQRTAVSACTLTDGTTRAAAMLNFDGNAFHREFAAPVELGEQARTLPQMQGAGWVRDLREVAMLSAAFLADFIAASARAGRQSVLDRLLDASQLDGLHAWADTPDMQSYMQKITPNENWSIAA